MPPKRHYNRWNSDELKNLHKEYNLRELTVQEIAKLHRRSVFSILNKLQNENLIDSKWTNARGWKWDNSDLDNSDFDNSDSENFDNTENVVKPFVSYFNKNDLNNKYYEGGDEDDDDDDEDDDDEDEEKEEKEEEEEEEEEKTDNSDETDKSEEVNSNNSSEIISENDTDSNKDDDFSECTTEEIWFYKDFGRSCINDLVVLDTDDTYNIEIINIGIAIIKVIQFLTFVSHHINRFLNYCEKKLSSYII
jgi:cobalamin biosynthesis protein CobT